LELMVAFVQIHLSDKYKAASSSTSVGNFFPLLVWTRNPHHLNRLLRPTDLYYWLSVDVYFGFRWNYNANPIQNQVHFLWLWISAFIICSVVYDWSWSIRKVHCVLSYRKSHTWLWLKKLALTKPVSAPFRCNWHFGIGIPAKGSILRLIHNLIWQKHLQIIFVENRRVIGNCIRANHTSSTKHFQKNAFLLYLGYNLHRHNTFISSCNLLRKWFRRSHCPAILITSDSFHLQQSRQ
jgi:hypothetical protein